MQPLERLLKLREVNLDHAERALAVEDAHEQKFLRPGGSAGHEYLPLHSGVVHLVEGLAIELTPELARRSVDGGSEGADGHHIGRVGEAELSDRAAARIEGNARDETRVVFQPRERSSDPGFCYSRIGHELLLAAFIISSLTRPRLASVVTIVTSTTSRAPTTKM